MKRNSLFALLGAAILIIALVAVPFLTSCAALTPAPEPAKHFSWRFQPYEPPPTEPYNEAVRLVDRIYERSDGRLKIEVAAPGILGYPSYTGHRPVSEGLLSMAETASGGVSEQPVFRVLDQAIFDDIYAAWTAWDAILPDIEAAAERMNCKLLMTIIKPPSMIQSKKPLQTMADFKGLKFRSWSPVLSVWIEEMGATAMVVPYAELYTALATGVAEANTLTSVGFVERSMWEVTPYFNMIPTLVFVCPCVVNLDDFNALPSDLQQILLEECAKSQEWQRNHQIEAIEPALVTLQEQGAEVIYPDQEVLDRSKEAFKTATKKFADGADPETLRVLKKALEAMGKSLD